MIGAKCMLTISTSSRASHADTSKGERPISIEPFSQCALFSDTEGNMFELRSRGHI